VPGLHNPGVAPEELDSLFKDLDPLRLSKGGLERKRKRERKREREREAERK
jgi:hypothetical protein